MPDAAMDTQLAPIRNLRIVKLPIPSTTATLNHCISTSQADIIAILDDDAVPYFGWLESHVAAFINDPDLVYTSGREVRFQKERSSLSEFIRIVVESFFGLFIEKNKRLNGRIVGWVNNIGVIFGNFDQPGICLINSPRGCNMAVRRTLFCKGGGFNVHFRGNAWGFEAEFGLRMAKEGRYGQYCGDAIVIHHESPAGGSRAKPKRDWYKDFLFNHSLVIKLLGLQAWFGSIPRLLKNFLN